jgi:N-acetylneuraminate synthase
MKSRYSEAIIGHSDHTPDLYTCFAAVALGAKIIEKHVILDKNQPGPDRDVSIEFSELSKLVDGIRKIEVSLGNQKIIHEKEVEIRKWAFRSIVVMRDIRCGDLLLEDDLWSKRPGTGIPSYRMSELVGRKAISDIKKNTLLRWQDIEGGEVQLTSGSGK